MKIVLDFIRITDSGSIERVTWLKQEAGIEPKFLVHKTGYNPSAEERHRILASQYGSISLMAA